MIVSGLLVAGCGGGGEDPEDVLTATFSGDHQVNSGTLDMTVSGSVEGSTGGNIDASISGPFQAEEGQFPQFDLTASVTGEGAGQSVDFQGGLTSTGDKLYVTYQDTPYVVPDDVFKQVQQNYQASAADTTSGGSFQERCQQAADQGGFDASLCDTDPLSLVTNLDNEGDEDVEGTETVHVSGDVNIEEIGNLATEAIAASPSGQFLPSDQLDQLSQQFEDAVDEAQFRRLLGHGRRHPQAARPQHRRDGTRVGGPARPRERRQRRPLDQPRRGQRAADDRGSVRREAAQ